MGWVQVGHDHNATPQLPLSQLPSQHPQRPVTSGHTIGVVDTDSSTRPFEPLSAHRSASLLCSRKVWVSFRYSEFKERQVLWFLSRPNPVGFRFLSYCQFHGLEQAANNVFLARLCRPISPSVCSTVLLCCGTQQGPTPYLKRTDLSTTQSCSTPTMERRAGIFWTSLSFSADVTVVQILLAIFPVNSGKFIFSTRSAETVTF